MKKIQLSAKTTCFFVILCLIIANNVISQTITKDQQISNFRQQYTATPVHYLFWNGKSYKTSDLVNNTAAYSYSNLKSLLGSDGIFTDMVALEKQCLAFLPVNTSTEQALYADSLINKCLARLMLLNEVNRGKSIVSEIDNDPIFKGIIHYGNLEINRPNDNYRFLTSCFFMPGIATNCYFALLPLMEAVENGSNTNAQTKMVHDILVKLGYQAWTQPYRNDATDANPVSVNRFRANVWWNGGNALDYRPLIEVAAMMRRVDMVDVVAQVSQLALIPVSQCTIDTAFWIEDITADGLGWGHGRQFMPTGYPRDGASAAISALISLKGSAFERQLSRDNVNTLLEYIRGTSFIEYKGLTPPMVSRSNAVKWNGNLSNAAGINFAGWLLNNFGTSITTQEAAELNQYKSESNAYSLFMSNYAPGTYSGTRYFFNNDNMAKKSTDYYLFIDMASNRCDGLESASGFNQYNIYARDGVTFFERSGNEHLKGYGAYTLSGLPGTTNRALLNSSLVPITNWSGFNSQYNYAGGATSGGDNFATGFIYLKQNASSRYGSVTSEPNSKAFGVKAFKSNFMLGDLFVGLGAGITNLSPSISGTIATTVEQTPTQSDYSTQTVGGLSWVTNNGFSYAVLTDKSTGIVQSTNVQKTTNWKFLDATNTLPEDLLNIMTLTINHGTNVKNGTYAYLVNCKGSIPTSLPVILQNDTTLQAVVSADGKTLGATFYSNKPVLNCGTYLKGDGVSTNNLTISVSQPCILLIESTDLGYKISVSDPLARCSGDVIVTLNSSLKLNGPNAVSDATKTQITFSLPSLQCAGKPITYNYTFNGFSKQTLVPIEDSYTRGGTYNTTNYGTSNTLTVRDALPNYKMKTYLKFNVKSVDLSTVNNAKLRLYSTTIGGSCNVRLSQTSNDWSETTITDSNAPINGTQIDTLTIKYANTYNEWDITNFLKNRNNKTDSIVSFVLDDPNLINRYINFNSRKATENQPQLVLLNEVKTGLNNTLCAGDMLVYPNPTSNVLHIQLQNSNNGNSNLEILLFDVYGRLVYKQTKNDQNSFSLSIGHLPKGLYLLQVKSEKQQMLTQKVVLN